MTQSLGFSRSAAALASHVVRCSALISSNARIIAFRLCGTPVAHSPRNPIDRFVGVIPNAAANAAWLIPSAFNRICHGVPSMALDSVSR